MANPFVRVSIGEIKVISYAKAHAALLTSGQPIRRSTGSFSTEKAMPVAISCSMEVNTKFPQQEGKQRSKKAIGGVQSIK